MTFGEKLYQARKEKGLSQEQLSELCGVSRQSVSKWESGQGYPEAEKLPVLSHVLNIGLDYLMIDEAGTSAPTHEEHAPARYQDFLGKWVTIMIKDSDLPAVTPVILMDVTEQYMLVAKGQRSTLMPALLKTADIQSVSTVAVSKKQEAKSPPNIETSLHTMHNPYLLFEHKVCLIRFRRGDWSKGAFGTYFGGYYAVTAESVTDDAMILCDGEKQISVNIEDILFITEQG